MDAYFPMASTQREAETMVYLRESLRNSQSETPLLPSDIATYTNCPSTSGAYTGAYSENSRSQSSCINMDMNSNTSHQEFLLNTVHSHWSTWGTASGVLQGLSLTLGPHTAPVMQIPDIRYRNNNPNITSLFGLSALVTNEDVGKNMNFESEGDFQNKQQFPSVPFYGMMNIASSVSSSKYLKAVQQLLDEVINVKKAIKSKNYKKGGDGEPETPSSDPSAMAASSFPPIAAASSKIELSASEKQELHSRLTQLLALLDEVDRRYTQYYHQIQMIISSFDSKAGSGVGKSYTSLALQTISRHFRSLRDAINKQIHVARRSLGEEDTSLSDKVIGISRFRYVDRSIRQQRALQQVGITQQQGWRPQRGLPEGSVSVLRAWLFEHFLHPYPKDSDKIMLARKTGLTRCQVSNWFINARVRLWKPMIEEMHREELVDVDMDSNSSSETSQKPGKSSTNLTADKSENPEASVALIGTNTNPIGAREITSEIHENTTAESNSGGSGTAECRNINNRISLTLGLQQQDEIDPTSIVDSSRHGFLHLRENNVYNSAASAKATEFDSMDSGNPAFQR